MNLDFTKKDMKFSVEANEFTIGIVLILVNIVVTGILQMKMLYLKFKSLPVDITKHASAFLLTANKFLFYCFN